MYKRLHGFTQSMNLEGVNMVITELKQLIDELTEIYEAEGNKKTVVIRAGKIFPEIEITIGRDTVYIEAYTENEP